MTYGSSQPAAKLIMRSVVKSFLYILSLFRLCVSLFLSLLTDARCHDARCPTRFKKGSNAVHAENDREQKKTKRRTEIKRLRVNESRKRGKRKRKERMQVYGTSVKHQRERE